MNISELKGKQIAVYGAGRIAQQVVRIMLSLGISVKRVIVSSGTSNPFHLHGIDVYEVNDIDDWLVFDVVLVCTLEKYHSEIKEILEEKGCYNYRFVSERDAEMLDEIVPACIMHDTFREWYRGMNADVLQQMCKEKKYDYLASKDCYRQYMGLIDSGELVIPRLVVVLGTKCSLRCRDCNNLIPYFKPQYELDTTKIIDSINIILGRCYKILRLELIGGEPFLCSNLKEVLQNIISNRSIEQIEITTNGTIIPNEELKPLLKNENVKIRISNYEPLVSSNKIEEYLKSNDIRYEILEGTSEWIDAGGIEKRNRTKSALVENYRRCQGSRYCRTLYENHIFKCARAASLFALGKMSEDDKLCVNDNLTANQVKQFWIEEYSAACDYCDMGNDELRYVKSAIQCDRNVD